MLLEILKYLGLSMATGSSIWAATNVESKEVGGRKHLTRAGWISIGLTVFGLLLSVFMNILQDKADAVQRAAKEERDLERIDAIEFSSQPLVSLKVQWVMDGIPISLMDHFSKTAAFIDTAAAKSQGEAPDFNGDLATYERIQDLYPFINIVADEAPKTIPAKELNTLVLMTLDQAPNTVLPIGCIDTTAHFDDKNAADIKTNGISGGIDFLADRGFLQRMPNIARPISNYASLKTTGKQQVTIEWDLDARTLFNSLDRVDGAINPTTNIPKTLRIVVVSDFTRIPLSSNNTALFSCQNMWEPDTLNWQTSRIKKHGAFRNATITLTPNNRSDMAITYKLMGIFNDSLMDEYDDEYGGSAVMFVFHAVPSKAEHKQ